MHRRLALILLMLTAALQGPVLTYASTLGSSIASMSNDCGGQIVQGAQECNDCCMDGAMPSCAAQCPAPVAAAVPVLFPDSVRIATRGITVPDFGVNPFADFDPPHLLRPPIV